MSAFAFAVGCGTVLLFSGRLRAGWITGGLLGTAALALYPPVGRKWLGDTFRRLGNVRRLAEDQYAALWLTRWEHTMEEMASQVPMPWADKPPMIRPGGGDACAPDVPWRGNAVAWRISVPWTRRRKFGPGGVRTSRAFCRPWKAFVAWAAPGCT